LLRSGESRSESDLFLLETTDKERRRLLNAYWAEHARVDALRRRMIAADTTEDEDGECEASRRALFFIDHRRWPPPMELPSWPEFPSECVNMVCGGIGRRSGRPCQSKEIYTNGRCKWHGEQAPAPGRQRGRPRACAICYAARSYRTLEKADFGINVDDAMMLKERTRQCTRRIRISPRCRPAYGDFITDKDPDNGTLRVCHDGWCTIRVTPSYERVKLGGNSEGIHSECGGFVCQ
jgi:hypothetical protein